MGLRPRSRKRRGRRRWQVDSETRQAITGSVDRFLQGEESTEDAISLLARRFPFGIAGMHSELSEWRGLRILMDHIEDWGSASPKVFLMFWKHAVWESQAAARRFDHNPPIALYLQPWTVTIACLPAMKARYLCNSLRAILNLSITCTSLRRLCCRELRRWWTQIRRAVVNEEVNGKYLDGIPFATIVRLASSVGSGFATTTIRERGPQRRTLESDIMRSLELWPDEEEPESGSSSSECP